jgi:hypothetical protein
MKVELLQILSRTQRVEYDERFSSNAEISNDCVNQLKKLHIFIFRIRKN